MSTARRILALVLAAWLATACGAPVERSAAPASSPAGASAAGAGAPPAAALTNTSPAAAPASPAAGSTAGAERPVPQPLSPPMTVRVANAAIAAQSITFLALEAGYFHELGLELEVIPLTATNDMVALLSQDQLEVGHQAISPALFNAAARDVGVRMVADHGGNIPGRTTPSLAVRADHLPWTGYQQLKGWKLAISGMGTMSEYDLELMLKRGGLTLDDVEVVPLAFPDIAVAFSNKAIDAAIFNEPWATQLEQAGVIKKVLYTDDVDPNGNVSGVMFSETFARNTPAARNYTVALLRGIRDYWDAYDGRIDFQRMVDVLQKYTTLKDEALIRKVPPTGQNPNGYLNLEKMALYQDWFIARGLVPQRVDLAKVVDHSFLDYANAVLGPYQPVANPRRPS